MASPAPIVGRSTSAALRAGGQPHTGGGGKAGGVAAAEFTLQDVLRLAADTRRMWMHAAEEMSAGEMGHETVALCVAFAEASALFDQRMRQLHGGVWAAINDAAVVGHSSRYVNR